MAVTSLPEAYESRLTDMALGQFKHLRLRVPDPYDCILSKLERNSSKDRDDADYLFRSKSLDVEVLRQRYQEELRPYLPKEKWHDQTLDMWIDIFKAPSQS